MCRPTLPGRQGNGGGHGSHRRFSECLIVFGNIEAFVEDIRNAVVQATSNELAPVERQSKMHSQKLMKFKMGCVLKLGVCIFA